jgi:hypothetical protein
MDFQDYLGIAALVGVALVVIGTLLLALVPNWRGFQLQRAEEEPKPGALERLVGAFVDAITGFLSIVRDMVTGAAGKYHPGQVLIAVGFLLFLLCGATWLIAQLASQ